MNPMLSQIIVTVLPLAASRVHAADTNANRVAAVTQTLGCVAFWGEGREATYEDFPLLGRGPFGQAIRICKEEDATFRPFLFVPRARLHNSPPDIKGAGKSVTIVVWAIRESGNHALAGIWHEGTDLKQKETASVRKVQRGQRQ